MEYLKTIPYIFCFSKGETSPMKENKFQSELIKELHDLFPGSIVLKNDANYIQGFPDLTILYGDQWAVLECKRDGRSRNQPNQEYYVDWLNDMSFSRFIHPGNKEEVLDELQRTFSPTR